MSSLEGWEVRNYEGRRLGTVAEVVGDPETGEASRIVVTTGKENLIGGDRAGLSLSLEAVRIDPEQRVLLVQAGPEEPG
ncbi:MAG: PRC-barrel domain-containing protein [Acidimicrobiia bacterium]